MTPPPPPPPPLPPPLPNPTPHLLDLSPSDHLSDHKALPLTRKAQEQEQEQECKTEGGEGGEAERENGYPSHGDDFPDRSTYQQLPDSPGTTGSTDLFVPTVNNNNSIYNSNNPFASIATDVAGAGEATVDRTIEVEDREEEEGEVLDLEALRTVYKRAWGGAAGQRLVKKDVGFVRRERGGPLSPVLSLEIGSSGSMRKDPLRPPQPQPRNNPFSANTPTPPPPPPPPPLIPSTSISTPAGESLKSIHRDSPRAVPASLSNQAIIASAKLNEPHAALSSASPSPPQPQQPGINDASDASESISEVSTVSSASMEEEESWIASFCNVIGHEYFVEVSEDFIEDDFNLTGLGAIVPMYKEALEMILDVEPESSSESLGSASESLSENATSYRRPRGHQRSASDYSMIETSAELLYGLVHQRFITSRQGIQVMYEKYLLNHFGFCPRVNCNSARVLPCGYSDTPGTETVKLFCPSCCDIYVPPNSRFQTVDGAYFGTTFPTLFLMTFPELDISGNGKKEAIPSNSLNSVGGRKGGSGTLPPINGVPENNIAPGLGKGKRYEMRIYGFRVNERARSGPRMGWLRERPEDVRELDEMARFEERDGYESDEEEMVEEDEEDEVMEDGGGGAVTTLSPVRGGWPGDFQSRS